MKGKEGLRIDLLYMDVLVSSLGFPHFHFIIRHEGGVLPNPISRTNSRISFFDYHKNNQ